MSSPSYEFYEKVIVKTKDDALKDINGKIGAVLGRAESEECWFYSVYFYDIEVCYCLKEVDLSSIGEFDGRSSFFNGATIAVTPEGDLGQLRWIDALGDRCDPTDREE